MTTWLINPFTYIAGLKSLLIGWAFILITAVIAFYTKTHFDGVIDAHTGLATPIWYYIAEPLIDWLVIVLLFFIAGRLFSVSDVRFIDVAGTQAMARAPMLLMALLLGIPAGDIMHPGGMAVVLMIGATIVSIWMIALMYNAFRVSCNIKSPKGIIIFIVALIIAEVIVKIILHFLLYKPLK